MPTMLENIYFQYYNNIIDRYCFIGKLASSNELGNSNLFIYLISHRIKEFDEGIFSTSGTTNGNRQQYKFGDLKVIYPIELLCKYPHGKNYIVQLYFNSTNFFTSKVADKTERHFNHYITSSDPIKVIDDLLNLLSQKDKIQIWTSDKNNLMFLLSDNYFVDFLLQNKERISIINTGISPFFKKKKLLENGFHINDNMIDWYSGLNFYTCKYNKKHILPIFYAEENKSTNLLNLSLRGRMVPKGDYFYYSPLGYCECGKTHYDLKFIPHIKTTPIVDGEYFYDMEIPELIEGSYYNLQFVQIDEKTLDIYYTGNLTDCDRQIIEERTKMFQFKNYKPNSVFSINHKQPPFHKIYYQKQFL